MKADSKRTLIGVGLAVLLAGCSIINPPGDLPPDTTAGPIQTTESLPDSSESAASPTPFEPEPTATAVPVALMVNGEPVHMAEFEAAVLRYQAAHPSHSPETANMAVKREFISQLLLGQAAAEVGFVVDDALLQSRFDALVESVGGQTALQGWLDQNGYTEAAFLKELGRAIAAAWMRDRIVTELPVTAEQVRARQILVLNQAEANDLFAQLQAGTDFDQLAFFYDPIALGEMGWFPKGYILEPLIEEAAFALEPGEFSPVIETRLGFHIIQVTDRQADRPLEADARITLQTVLLDNWLDEREAQSDIVILCECP
jgi:hypothetical protein